MKTLIFIILLSFTNGLRAESNPFELVGYSDNIYLLNKKTGRVWEKFCFKKEASKNISCSLQAWKEMNVIGLNSTQEKLEAIYRKNNEWRERLKNIGK